MTNIDTSAAEVIRDLAQAADAPSKLLLGNFYTLVTPAGLEKIDLTGDEYRDVPKRKSGRVAVRDVASFAHYYGKHADAHSEVFADLDQATITAVLDAHMASDASEPEFQARWQRHRLILGLQKTEPWKTWTAAIGRLMGQQGVA